MRQMLSNLVKIQPPEDEEGNFGPLYHRHDLGIAPWVPYDQGRNLQTCQAQQLFHLKRNPIILMQVITHITYIKHQQSIIGKIL